MRRRRRADSTSEYGHGVPLSTRVSPECSHAIQVLISSDRWDYQTTSGFILSAVLHELERCEVEEPGIGEWHHVELIEEIIRVKDEQLRFNNVILGLRSQLDAMADAGEWEDLQRHLENIMATIHKQQDGSRKRKYLEYMKEFELRMQGFGKSNSHRAAALEEREGAESGKID